MLPLGSGPEDLYLLKGLDLSLIVVILTLLL